MNWIIPANGQKYNHSKAFHKWGYIDWAMKANYMVNDIVYIYCTRPHMKIMFKSQVEKINLSFSQKTDDKEFWTELDKYESDKSGKYARLRFISQVDTELLTLSNLLEHGLSGVPQRPLKCSDDLSRFIEERMNDYHCEGFFNDEEDISENSITEGATRKVLVNKYERSLTARNKCIEYHGCNCLICGIDFEQYYGDIGKGFIHVHHKIPLGELKKDYKVNYKDDLVPICPNCHAMLHRKLDGKHLTFDELKDHIKKK